MPTRYKDGAARSHEFGTPESTCLERIRTGLQDLMGKEYQVEPAYKVSGRGCRISRVENYRSFMPTRYQEVTSGSHGFDTPDRTCLLGVRTVLHDLTGSEHKIVHAYNVSGPGCRISRVGCYRSYLPTRHQEGTSGSHGFEKTDRTCLLPVGVRTSLHDLTDSEHKIVHAYNVSSRSCRISRDGNYRSYMPSRHQEGTSGSHGFETLDRTCLLGVRTALYDLTGSEHKIVHAYKVSGRGCKISRVRNTRSYMHRRYQEGAAGSHG